MTVQDVLRDAIARISMPTAGDDLPPLNDACDALDFGKDEFAHFTLLFDLWRKAWPGERADVPAWGALPEGEALAELRYQVREAGPLGEIAVRLSEGGGLGLFFGIQDALEAAPGDFDRGLVRAVDRILDDERYHLIGNFAWAAQRVTDPGAIDEVVGLLDHICAVKLREREAQFALPLGGERPAGDAERYGSAYLAPMRAEIIRQARA